MIENQMLVLLSKSGEPSATRPENILPSSPFITIDEVAFVVVGMVPIDTLAEEMRKRKGRCDHNVVE